jgi:hypothetical protein
VNPIIHTVDQGTVEWFKLRAGIPTASEFDQLVTPEFKIRKGAMPESYLAKKLAEKWIGGPLPQIGSFMMEQGNIMEEEAIPWYEFSMGTNVLKVGFVTTCDGRVGCSPDGLLGTDDGIEIKCPAMHTHVKYLMDGSVPKDYIAQVQGAMFVTGRPQWTFVSYSRMLPPLVVSVRRNEDAMGALSDALGEFSEKLDAAWERLLEMNGGPPNN